MSTKNLVVAVCVAVSLFCSSEVFAQRGPFKLNQAFRYLGHGQSTGYHWRTPGPCIGYYNPYSRHNSSLRIGGLPQGAERYVPAYGFQDCNNNFAQPSTLSNMGPVGIAPGQMPIIDSEIDNDEYENDSYEDEDEDTLDDDAKSILDEIEAIEDAEQAGEKAAEEAKNIDGASLWSDVFELSRMGAGNNNQRRAANKINQRR